MYETHRVIAERGTEYLSAAGKAAPPIAVSTAASAGMTLQDWVLIATLLYTLLQIAYLGYKIARDHRERKAKGSADVWQAESCRPRWLCRRHARPGRLDHRAVGGKAERSLSRPDRDPDSLLWRDAC